MGRGAENGLPDGFKGRFIESVPAAFFMDALIKRPSASIINSMSTCPSIPLRCASCG